MEIDSKELSEYLSSALDAIQKGVEDSGSFIIENAIEFDLAVINTSEGGGGVKIYVAKAEGKLKTEQISRIKLKVKRNVPMGKASVIKPRIEEY